MMYAVLDTNVLVSALLSKKPSASVPMRLIQLVFAQAVIPVFNAEILEEYEEVLYRQKFHFTSEMVHQMLDAIKALGISKSALHSEDTFPDPDDRVFFEVAWSMYQGTRNTYLVTGNKRHFPKKEFVVSPRQMLNILETDD